MKQGFGNQQICYASCR